MNQDVLETTHKPAGMFEPGGPGGPGRPKGSRSRLSRVLDEMVEADAVAVYGVVKNMALGGDLIAVRILLDRAWPVPKSRAVAVDLGPIAGVSDLPAAVGKMLEAVAAGELLPDEAQALTGVVEAYRKAVELADIERRVTTLEARRT